MLVYRRVEAKNPSISPVFHEYLVGGWPTPLKNDGVRQLGWWHSQYMGKTCSKPPTRYMGFTSLIPFALLHNRHFGGKKLRSPTHGSEHRAPWKIRTPGIKNNMDHEDGISWVSWLTSWISSWQTSRYKYHGFHNQIYIYIRIYIYIIFSPKTRWKELLNREASSRSVWIQEISRHRIVGL